MKANTIRPLLILLLFGFLLTSEWMIVSGSGQTSTAGPAGDPASEVPHHHAAAPGPVMAALHCASRSPAAGVEPHPSAFKGSNIAAACLGVPPGGAGRVAAGPVGDPETGAGDYADDPSGNEPGDFGIPFGLMAGGAPRACSRNSVSVTPTAPSASVSGPSPKSI